MSMIHRITNFWKINGATSSPKFIFRKPEDVFDYPAALEINKARLANLDTLGIAFRGKSVIDIGCGIGHLAGYFTAKNCPVLCVDGRKENIRILKSRYPQLPARVIDIERSSLRGLKKFDIVFCYGLLYHTENPALVLERMCKLCKDILLIETVICDYDKPLVRFEEETTAVNQSLTTLACRPTINFIRLKLEKSGFRYLYTPKILPDYPDFKFKFKNNLEFSDKEALHRKIFIAAKSKIRAKGIMPL